MSKSKIDYKEVGRFLLVGGGATLADYIVYFLCNAYLLKFLSENVNHFISVFLGYTVGFFINWALSAKFVYRYGKKTTKKQFVIFLAITIFGLIITEIGMFLGTPLFNKLFIIGLDFWKLFFKCLMTVIVLIINYFGRKFLVFKEETNH